jgi:hypothetical protein
LLWGGGEEELEELLTAHMHVLDVLVVRVLNGEVSILKLLLQEIIHGQHDYFLFRH